MRREVLRFFSVDPHVSTIIACLKTLTGNPHNTPQRRALAPPAETCSRWSGDTLRFSHRRERGEEARKQHLSRRITRSTFGTLPQKHSKVFEGFLMPQPLFLPLFEEAWYWVAGTGTSPGLRLYHQQEVDEKNTKKCVCVCGYGWLCVWAGLWILSLLFWMYAVCFFVFIYLNVKDWSVLLEMQNIVVSKVYFCCAYHKQNVTKCSYSYQLKQFANNRGQNMSTVKRATSTIHCKRPTKHNTWKIYK